MNDAVIIAGKSDPFARMLLLELLESGISAETADSPEKVPSEVRIISTDFRRAAKPKDGEHTVYFGKTEPSFECVFFKIPFLVTDFVDAVKLALKDAKSDFPVKYDAKNNRFLVSDKEIPLSATEKRMLSCLLSHRGEPVSRDELFAATFGRDREQKSNAVNVYISYLRAKIEPMLGRRLIFTVRGKGFEIK